MSPDYPAEPVGGFPTPPRSVTDGEGRDIDVEVATAADHDDLLAMYREFHPEDRAQGIPPAREESLQEWLDAVTGEDCPAVLASHEGAVIGHALLVPDDTGAYELAIFVLRAYQGAHVGTELLETLLGHAIEQGIERVWLTVERWNTPAVTLYERVGFETVEEGGLELEMSIRLG